MGKPTRAQVPQSSPAAAPPPEREPLAPFRIGERAETASARGLSPPLAGGPVQAPLRMDKRAFGKMKRGKLDPEARLDLHGMTLAAAQPSLTGFILSSAAQGRRLVLVITGKGKARPDHGPIPQRKGLLRHQVPQWLAMPPLSSVVLQVTPAHARHGGEGAYYVYLRRGR